VLSLVTGPSLEPVSLAEAKLHLRVDGTDEDSLITRLITTARGMVEAETGRFLCSQVWKAVLNQFPAAGQVLQIPARPVQSVTAVTYLNDAGSLITEPLASFEIFCPGGDYAQAASLVPAVGKVWPSARNSPSSVQITFTAGYGLASAVPAPLKAALLLVLGDLFTNREAQISGPGLNANLAVSRLLGPYRAPTF
jgi:uncharacterized phiE125 gp8 family phage protein